MSELAKRLHQVDPDLKIIPGGSYHRRLGHMRAKDWGRAAGVKCRNCGREVFRSKDGLCLECWDSANEYEIRDRAGALEFLPMAVIKEIVHPAKKPNK